MWYLGVVPQKCTGLAIKVDFNIFSHPRFIMAVINLAIPGRFFCRLMKFVPKKRGPFLAPSDVLYGDGNDAAKVIIIKPDS